MFFYNDDPTFREEIKNYMPASVAITRGKIWPFLEQVERKYIKPLLGDEMYSELQAYYDDPESGGSGSGDDRSHYAEVLKLVQLAQINLAYFTGFDILNVKLSDAGFQRMEGENFRSPYKYQEENIRGSFENTGFDTLDDVLAYMEENIEHFPEWEDSSVYKKLRTSIIPDTSSFDGICSINKSRLIFLRLQPYMAQVIDFEIKPIIGAVEWKALETELAKDKPADKYKGLRTECQKPLAFLSAAMLVENSGRLTDRGLYFDGKNSGFPDNTTVRVGNQTEIGRVISGYRATGQKYLATLKQYLLDNDFTGFSGQTASAISRDNTGKKIFMT